VIGGVGVRAPSDLAPCISVVRHGHLTPDQWDLRGRTRDIDSRGSGGLAGEKAGTAALKALHTPLAQGCTDFPEAEHNESKIR